MPDPWEKYATPIGGAASVAPTSSPSTSSDPWDKYASPTGGSSPQIPVSGNPAPPPDPDEPWYKKVWDFANTPLTEQFGIPSERQGAGGFERAGEHILSGLTSPLSLALTAATFGTGGFIESAGASALREGLGLSAAEIAEVSKASEVASNAYRDLKPIEPVIQDALKLGGHDASLVAKAREALGPVNLEDSFGEKDVADALRKKGFTDTQLEDLGKASTTIQKAKAGFTPVEDAVRSAGLDWDKLQTARDVLQKNGLTDEDLTGGNLLERGAFQIIRKTVPDLPIASSVKIAKTANAVLNAGFTFQQFESAAALSPRFLDALKEGDSDKAWEYGTEALVGGALGLAGAPHALHAAGELFDPLLEPGNKLRPSDQTLAYNRAHQEREALQEVGSAEARAVDQKIREALGHVKPSGSTITLYRGEVVPNSGKPIADWIKQSPDFQKQEQAAGRWFTSDLSEAQEYAKEAGNGRVVKVEVPASEVEKYRPENDPEAGRFVHSTKQGQPHDEFFLPRNLASRAVPHTGEPSSPYNGKLSPEQKQLDMATVFHQVVTGGDQNKAAAWHNALAEAAGSDERIPVSGKTLNPDQELIAHFDRIADADSDKLTDEDWKQYGDAQQRELKRRLATGESRKDFDWNDSTAPVYQHVVDGITYSSRDTGNGIEVRATDANGRRVAETALAPTGDNGKEAFTTGANVPDDLQRQGFGKNLYKQLPAIAKQYGIDTITGEGVQSEGGQNLWKSLERDGIAKPTKAFGQTRLGMSTEGAPDVHQPAFDPKNAHLPENAADQIRDSKFKSQTPAYQKLVLDSLKKVATGDLTEKQLAAAKLARDEQAKNFEIGSANDLLHHQIDDYMTRVYKDTNEAGKVVASEAKTGRFATNVTMARQRVYDSHITALLKSPKEMDFDAASNVAGGRDSLIKAAANKQFIDTLRDKFTRASDGRPAVVLSGSGQVVHGPEGEDPATYIQPDRVRKIQVADSVVQHLTQTGDLARYLEDGSLKDITPKVYPDTLDTAIQKLRDQVQRIKDPHLGAMADTKLEVLLQAKALKGQALADALTTYNEGIKPIYAWDPQDYIKLDNAAMKGWNFVTNDTSGNEVRVRSDIKVHPEFAENLQNRLGLEQSSLVKHPVSAALLKANTKLKETLLSLSPFHMAQLALRGVMVGVNPFTLNTPDILNGEKIDPSDPNSVSIIRKAVEHGLTTGTDYKAEQQMSEGVSGGAGLLRKIPGVGKVVANSLDWYQDFLFKRFMPALKANAAESLFRDYQSAHPDWSVDRVAKATASHVNDTFGGINWKAMGRSATTQDWGRLLLLAPDWMESEMRSMGRLFNKDEGSIGRAQAAKMAMGLWGIARVMNYANTGNFHNEAPFGLAVKNKDGKEIIYSMRTLPTDMLHAAADPVNFIKGRLAPSVNMGLELATGRDRYQRKLAPEDLYADVFRNMAPIPLQAIGQAVSGTGPEVGNPAQVVKALGGTAQAYQTPAQKMADDLASTHSEDGVVDPSLQARHRRVMQFEDQVRNGEMPMSDLMRLTYQSDQLKESELKKIQLNLKQTQGLSADMASLYSRASRLPAKEYLQLLDTMNSSEKVALVPLTIQTQKKYLAKAKKDETPSERAKDPVFQRFLNMIPQQPQAPRPQPSVQTATPTTANLEFPYTATHPDTKHQIGSHDGVNWFDRQTGEAFNG